MYMYIRAIYSTHVHVCCVGGRYTCTCMHLLAKLYALGNFRIMYNNIKVYHMDCNRKISYMYESHPLNLGDNYFNCTINF